jgi:hypothetical protein
MNRLSRDVWECNDYPNDDSPTFVMLSVPLKEMSQQARLKICVHRGSLTIVDPGMNGMPERLRGRKNGED